MKPLLLSVCLLLSLLLFSVRAEAKGIPVVYNSGDHFFATGPLPPPLDGEPKLAGFEAGYLCQVQGVLWSYFSVSDCRPVAFLGETYVDEPEVTRLLAAKYTEADMQRGVWGRFGWMLLGLGVLAGAAIALKEKLTGEPDGDD